MKRRRGKIAEIAGLLRTINSLTMLAFGEELSNLSGQDQSNAFTVA